MEGFFDWDVPESIVKVTVALHNNLRFFYEINLVLIQNGNIVVVTEFPKGYKRCTVEVVKNVSIGCRDGEGSWQGKASNISSIYGRTIGKLDGSSVRGCLYIYKCMCIHIPPVVTGGAAVGLCCYRREREVGLQYKESEDR